MDSTRGLPGETGRIDIQFVLNGLRQLGYDGPVVAEPFQPSAQRPFRRRRKGRAGQKTYGPGLERFCLARAVFLKKDGQRLL